MRSGGKSSLVVARVVDEVVTFDPGQAVDEVHPKKFVEETDILDKQVDVVIASANGAVELQDHELAALFTEVSRHSPTEARSAHLG